MSANQDAFNQVLLIHSNCFKREVQIVQRNTNVHLIFHQLNLLHQIFHLACTQQIYGFGSLCLERNKNSPSGITQY